MLPNLNINISVNFLSIYNCNISKSKLAFPLSNKIYLSVIASIVLKLLRLKPEYFFLGHPVVLAADDDDNDGDDDFIVHSVVDKNETLQKIMSKVDDFVAKYTGDDLRNSVTREIRRRYNAKVKAFVTKKTNARAKVAEKAKTYSDFDWEKLVQSNELSNLSYPSLICILKRT